MSQKKLIKVSIIVPIYNAERYLGECIDSLVNQTLENIEIILVDDGSTDNSLNICNEYLTDNRVMIISTENRGISKTRNLGLSNAKGEYICFVDSDDYLDNKTYSTLFNEANKHDFDMVISGYHKVDDSGKVLYEFLPNVKFTTLEKDGFNYKDQILKTAHEDKHLWYVWRYIYKRDLLVDNKILFKGRFAEDSLFNLKCMINSNRIGALNSAFYYYRDTPGSLTSSLSNVHVFDDVMTQILDKKILFEENKFDITGDFCNGVMEHSLPLILMNQSSLGQLNKIGDISTIISGEIIEIVKKYKIRLNKPKGIVIFTVLIKYKLYRFLNLYLKLLKKRSKSNQAMMR